MYLIIGYAHLI